MNKFKPDQIPGPACAACLQGLVEATLAGSGLEPGAEEALRAEIAAYTAASLAAGRAPAHIATGFFSLAQERSGVVDPFTAKKEADFEAARAAVGKLGPQPDDFTARARVSILGNAIDHFFLADTGRLWEEGGGLVLGHDDLARAEALLRPGGHVVILGDNCGEQSFDRLLVEHLQGRGCAVSYVVKSGPAQNDLTLPDLAIQDQAYGLGEVLDWSPPAVGLDPTDLPTHLEELLKTADLVIAKGMGHFETLALAGGMLSLGAAPWPLLLLFLAKCQSIADRLSVEKGQGVALYLPDA